jgi:hypothetical protein
MSSEHPEPDCAEERDELEDYHANPEEFPAPQSEELMVPNKEDDEGEEPKVEEEGARTESEQAEPEDTVRALDDVGASSSGKWSSTPSQAAQITKDGLWRCKPLRAEYLEISKPDGLAAYNELLTRTYPEDSPQVIIRFLNRIAHEGRFFVAVEYNEIEYLNVTP